MKDICLLLLSICSLLFGSRSIAQDDNVLKGIVVNSKNKEAIPFSKVYNKSINQGTLCDVNGVFSIPLESYNDTLIISFIGFESKTIQAKSIIKNIIELKESVQIISEVHASAKSNDYLYEILLNTKKHLPKEESQTKAYFELKTFIDSQQTELLEAYYNLNLIDYNIKKLHLKAGRFALKEVNQTNFISIESSRAIVLLKLYSSNQYYPFSPTEFKKKKLHKNYRITLEKRYFDNEQNTIYVLNYFPRDSSSNYFNGQIWIDSNNHRLLKITENVQSTNRHPFLSIADGADSLNSVSLAINKTFRFENKTIKLDHIDFNYSLHYFSYASKTTGIRLGGKKADYKVTSTALLMAYDSTLFKLPKFRFPTEEINDYRKISSIPYNSFFWENNNENTTYKSESDNDFYFNNGYNVRSDQFKFQNTSSDSVRGHYEKPYITWSGKRIRFREELDKIEEYKKSTIVNSEKYKISVQLYLDANSYNDSTNFVTKTIIDPYESFFYLPMDKTTHCFINIYFDLMEIQRRKLDEKLTIGIYHHQDIYKIYDEFMVELNRYSEKILGQLERGTNIKELTIQNNIVKENLGIDNFTLFEITE